MGVLFRELYLAEVSNKMVQEITILKGTIRDYFAISVFDKHYEMFHDAFTDMMESKWGQLGVCRLSHEK